MATDLIGDRYVQRASAGLIIPNAPRCPTRARDYPRARHSPARSGRGVGARWRTGSACGSRHPASSMEYTASPHWPGSATSRGRWTSSKSRIYNCCESNAKALERGKVQIEHVAGTFRQMTSAPIIVNGGSDRADAALAADMPISYRSASRVSLALTRSSACGPAQLSTSVLHRSSTPRDPGASPATPRFPAE